MSDGAYKFEIPVHHKSIIKVIGVGGGGSNAVNHMYNQGIKDVEFVICNTDSQALKASPVPTKLQIGTHLTDGLGAGANPERGKNAALESKEDIRELLSNNTKMVFITAGMGGGTGTGAAPVIAKIAKDLDILTVGIVTAPFAFEGKKKRQQADQGITELKENCDTVLVILNDKLREIYGNLSIRDAFAESDSVLTNAAKSIAEIITVTSEVNVDFADVQTVMKNSGAAVMGSAVTRGESRARKAAEEALASPLLNNTSIQGAKKILLSVSYGQEAELRMDELTEITDYIEEQAGYSAEVIFGQGIDPTLGDQLRVTVIATGFEVKEIVPERRTVIDLESDKQVRLNQETEIKKSPIVTFDLEKPREIAPEIKPAQPIQSFQEYKPFSEYKPVEEPKMEEINKEEAAPAKEEKKEEEQNFFTVNTTYEFEVKPREKEDFKNENRFEFSKKEEESENAEENKRILMEQAKERIKRLKGLNNIGSQNMDPEEFKEKLEVPAYLRKKIDLPEPPHSSEKEISRFNLSDENEILGNNKFLHDNVD